MTKCRFFLLIMIDLGTLFMDLIFLLNEAFPNSLSIVSNALHHTSCILSALLWLSVWHYHTSTPIDRSG